MSSKIKPEENFPGISELEDFDGLVNGLSSDPSHIKGLLEAIPKDKGSLKYVREKAISGKEGKRTA